MTTKRSEGRREPMKILIRKHHGTIYPERGGYTGVIDLGYDGHGNRIRIKKKGRTKQAVADRLVKAVDDLEAGIATSDSYTIEDAVRDWLAHGTRDLDEHTVKTYRILIDKHLVPKLGAIKLKSLNAKQVDQWLDGLTETLSTASLHKLHSALKRSIRQAMARDMVARNVAELVTTPRGRTGRQSKALTLDQAIAVLAEARTHWLYAYVALSLLTGVRTEEARAIQWSHVVAWVQSAQRWQPVTEAGFDHDKLAVYVWRSVRASGDTKTQKSRRTLEVPDEVAKALRQHHQKQAAKRLRKGERWQDNDLVFCTRDGKPLAAGNVRRAFRNITNGAGIGEDWTPRELRHTFVSILSEDDVPIEKIADLVGHRTTIVTQSVYRHQLRPAIATGAITMNTIFNRGSDTQSG
jgi:integrase